ncbi:SHOCT domain-containing protein [Microbacterium sp. cx-59]|uniref:SHOCT domain-containing protein n=1 Tax=Microbacterium sp. cx-59 TaxID=2891207 RepID=UPI001E3E660B|nr:SHOCT domain-containing protein [Microbacterium sp. cx-59]MCC4908111.1 SHOCT domain-containing protein [Microbacterium sp. cx-59]
MAFLRRVGRPGLIGLAARTAVVAGTATAVSGGITAHQQKKAHDEFAAEQHAAEQPADASVDLVTELQKLGDLRAAGVLDDAEFAAAKARLLH